MKDVYWDVRSLICEAPNRKINIYVTMMSVKSSK